MLGFLQRLGRALQLPIAVLPVAALLLRFGQPDLLDMPFIAQAGGAVFDNLALIFAIGVAATWSKDNAGSAALAGAVGYFILTKGASVIGDRAIIAYAVDGNLNHVQHAVTHSGLIPKAQALIAGKSVAFSENGKEIVGSIVQSVTVAKVNMGVLAGIVAGLVGGMAYNRWSETKLPAFLSFFGGRRFVPIASGFICLLLAALFGYVWPPIQEWIRLGGEKIMGAGPLGAGLFGFVNRLLIPTGLHQIINTIAWFQVGDYQTVKDGVQTLVHGDLNRFYAGDGTAGMFMSGFFPIMMFGLPGVAFAIYFAAPRDRRAGIGGMLLSVALTAFLTGVTEPIEFLFMFLAPALYLIHAIFTGVSLYIATLLNVHAGFSFSAGAIDYALMFQLPAAQNAWILLLMGLIAFALYFSVFYFTIRTFNLKTPGREDLQEAPPTANNVENLNADITDLARRYVNALGGQSNIVSIEACITRLRLVLKDAGAIDEHAIQNLGATGVIKLNRKNVQIIIGPQVDAIADAMHKLAV